MIRSLMLGLVAVTALRAQSFEVASIKRHPPAVDAPVFKNPDVNPIRISGNRVELRTITLKDLPSSAVETMGLGGMPATTSLAKSQ